MSKEPLANKLVCFDLEGPLSPQDNAYEVMALIPNGKEIFEIISHYDDVLTLQEKPGYEPGDTLSLIVPFLIHHKIGSERIKSISEKAKIVDGAADLVSWLKNAGCEVRIISTSYSQHALTVANKVGIEPYEVACTALEIDQMIEIFSRIGTSFIDQLEQEIMSFYPPIHNLEELTDLLDDFYWNLLPAIDLGKAVSSVVVMGGIRKLEAAKFFASELEIPIQSVAAVGDSITDFKMLNGVKTEGGLAVAFNSNEYALPYASVGLASTTLADLKPLFDVWSSEELDGIKNFASTHEGFEWIDGLSDLNDALDRHKNFRKKVRGEASKLG